MIIKYILSAIVAMFADILAYLLAPIASLPIFIRVRDGREHLVYYFKQYCIELQFGWKLYRNDPDKKCMLALRTSPFKNYPKKDLRNDR